MAQFFTVWPLKSSFEDSDHLSFGSNGILAEENFRVNSKREKIAHFLKMGQLMFP